MMRLVLFDTSFCEKLAASWLAGCCNCCRFENYILYASLIILGKSSCPYPNETSSFPSWRQGFASTPKVNVEYAV